MHRGSITKTGNGHVRRVLVEAAGATGTVPLSGIHMRRRSEGQPPEVLAYAHLENRPPGMAHACS